MARRKFELLFAPETVGHMDAIEAKYRGLIVRTIDQQLSYTPEKPTRNRKSLDELGPFGATWELRFGAQNRFRVFYEVAADVAEVYVLAIGVKQREKLFIGGEGKTPIKTFPLRAPKRGLAAIWVKGPTGGRASSQNGKTNPLTPTTNP